MFSFVKNVLNKIYSAVTSPLAALFARKTIDQDTLDELETLLIQADASVAVTKHLVDQLKQEWRAGKIDSGQALKSRLQEHLTAIATAQVFDKKPAVILLVGINGSGKTTVAGKLANLYKNQGKRVLLAAGDTFRAAATQQLAEWAERLQVPVVIGVENQDPASVAFKACEKYKQEGFDVLIIDTAGRLQAKAHLMRELEKIGSVIKRHVPAEQITTLLTIDAMLGQNSFDQARLFHESTHLDGIVLTKLDGTGKGGIVFSIMREFGLPVAFISYGEQLDQLRAFEPKQFVVELLEL
jgi:fused signal recognition particle receptor